MEKSSDKKPIEYTVTDIECYEESKKTSKKILKICLWTLISSIAIECLSEIALHEDNISASTCVTFSVVSFISLVLILISTVMSLTGLCVLRDYKKSKEKLQILLVGEILGRMKSIRYSQYSDVKDEIVNGKNYSEALKKARSAEEEEIGDIASNRYEEGLMNEKDYQLFLAQLHLSSFDGDDCNEYREELAEKDRTELQEHRDREIRFYDAYRSQDQEAMNTIAGEIAGAGHQLLEAKDKVKKKEIEQA